MRVVALSPSFTEILKEFDALDHLIGVTDHCEEVRAWFTPIGSPKALQINSIAGLKPDLILSDQNENRPEEIRVLQKQFKVISFDVRSVQAVLETITALGRMLSKGPEASRLIEKIQSEESENKKIFAEHKPIPGLLLLWNTPFLSMNFDTYISRLMEASGFYNVFHAEPVRELPLDLEDLIEKNPEALILPSDPFPFKKRHIAAFRQYRNFSKIAIELIDGKLISRFGPRTAEALKMFREIALSVHKKIAAEQGTP